MTESAYIPHRTARSYHQRTPTPTMERLTVLNLRYFHGDPRPLPAPALITRAMVEPVCAINFNALRDSDGREIPVNYDGLASVAIRHTELKVSKELVDALVKPVDNAI